MKRDPNMKLPQNKATVDQEQLNELFGLRIGKTEAQKYPHMADVLKYSSDHNRGPLGLPDLGHGYNFNRHMPKIEAHPHFRKAVEVCDEDNERHSLKQQMDHPSVQAIAKDLGHSTFQVHDYCSKGPYYRRWGSMDFDKYSPTDGPTSPYFDRHPGRNAHEEFIHDSDGTVVEAAMAKKPAATSSKKAPVIKKTERKKPEATAPSREQQTLPKIKKGTTHSGAKAAEIVVRPAMKSIREDCDRAVVAWGRMNPPTIGHQYLVETVAAVAEEQNAFPMLYLSRTMDKKNPLSLNERMELVDQAFGNLVEVQNVPEVTNTLAMLKNVNETFKNITVVTGSEHEADYMRMFLAYNGTEFHFNEMEVVVLQRDERSTDLTEAVSATMLREAARNRDIELFTKGLPVALQEQAVKLMDVIQWGMMMQEATIKNPAVRAIVEYRNKNI